LGELTPEDSCLMTKILSVMVAAVTDFQQVSITFFGAGK